MTVEEADIQLVVAVARKFFVNEGEIYEDENDDDEDVGKWIEVNPGRYIWIESMWLENEGIVALD